MKRLLCLLILPGLLALSACGDDDSPMAPAAPVFDEITVSLDQINIERDCDGGSGGEFSYKFYVLVYEDDVEIASYLSQDFSSFSSGNFTAWDPNVETTFTLERKSNLRFSVRVSVRELDSLEDFSQGSLISHVVASGRPAWAPREGDFIGEYDLYDSAQQVGVIEWDFDVRTDCLGDFTYSVTVEEGQAP